MLVGDRWTLDARTACTCVVTSTYGHTRRADGVVGAQSNHRIPRFATGGLDGCGTHSTESATFTPPQMPVPNPASPAASPLLPTELRRFHCISLSLSIFKSFESFALRLARWKKKRNQAICI